MMNIFGQARKRPGVANTGPPTALGPAVCGFVWCSQGCGRSAQPASSTTVSLTVTLSAVATSPSLARLAPA